MSILTRTAHALQALLGPLAEEVAQQVPVVRRRRKFTPATLAQTFILGFLARPHASDEELARTAMLCGVAVSPQALAQRFTDTLATFLQALFSRAVRHQVQAQRPLASLVERFPAVILQDSTTITLPAALRDRFPGCGGSHDAGQAAMKLQVQLDLRGGALAALAVEAGKASDQRSPVLATPMPAGGLRIADLGYFDVEGFREVQEHEGFWISRLAFGTALFTAEGQAVAGIAELLGPARTLIDRPILLGRQAKLRCRLVAWRVPQEVANRRRQKLLSHARAKGARPPSAARLAWCDWTIYVTNVPVDRLTPEEIAVLYGARWQIELMFKRWKSLGRVADLEGSTVTHQMVRLWSRLLAMLVQHWLLVACVWGDRRSSWHKACVTIRDMATHLASAVGEIDRLVAEIQRLSELLGKLARRDKRKQPGTFELLNDPAGLGWEP